MKATSPASAGTAISGRVLASATLVGTYQKQR